MRGRCNWLHICLPSRRSAGSSPVPRSNFRISIMNGTGMKWEDKWDRFVNEIGIRTNPDGTFVSGEEVWSEIPGTLYHATSPVALEKIKKAGGLGYSYRAHDSFLDKRDWSREGIGVYLAFSPDICVHFMGKGPESEMEDKWKESIILSIKKTDLDHSKFFVDEDVCAYADSTDPWEFREWLENGAVYYEGVIPFSKCTVSRYVDVKKW